MDNTYTIKNSLCYIDKHWKTLFRSEFPCIPVSKQGFNGSVIFQMLSGLRRVNRKGKV